MLASVLPTLALLCSRFLSLPPDSALQCNFFNFFLFRYATRGRLSRAASRAIACGRVSSEISCRVGPECSRRLNTGADFDKLLPMLHLHYMTRILTSIGLDREAVGVQLECRTDVLKETMFMIQDHMRKILQRGW